MNPQDQLLQRAAALRRAGRVQEAITAYEELLRSEPNLPDSWYNLGWLQRQAGLYDAALQSYAQALERGVGGAEEVHLNRALILSDYLGRYDEAEAELRAALRLKPDYVPALLNLGNLDEDRGDRAAARTAYESALAASPDHPMALARLAGVSHSSELDSNLAQRLRKAIANPRLSLADQANLGFALAGLLDAAGHFNEAFDAATRANGASRAASGARYDPASVERYVDRLLDARLVPSEAAAEQAPVFILGMYRSGSTLVEQLLGGHSRISPAGELDLLPRLVGSIRGYPDAIVHADKARVASWREFYLSGLAPFAREGAMVTDKRPDNFLHVGLIKSLFPNAKIVHTRRNRLDNLVSLYFLHLDPSMAYALDLKDAAHWYQQYERLMAHWKTLWPGDIFDVDYDELVRSPEPLLERLLEFLGLESEEGLVDFHSSSRPVRTASVWQVRQPLHTNSSGRWLNYSAQMKARLGERDESISER